MHSPNQLLPISWQLTLQTRKEEVLVDSLPHTNLELRCIKIRGLHRTTLATSWDWTSCFYCGLSSAHTQLRLTTLDTSER